MIGPVDYIAVGFKGNTFNGSILAELAKAVESKAIRVIDVIFVTKDTDGNVAATEVEEQSEDFKEITNLLSIDDEALLLAESDVIKIGETMENDTAAGVLVIENSWAKGLKQALVDAGGSLIAEGRIRPETVEAVSEPAYAGA